MRKTFIIGEIGINGSGNMKITKELIRKSAEAGADAVKFQKRTLDVVYTKEELDKPRESPWGTTNREQKEGLEFSKEDYEEIDRYCKEVGIEWFASAWDLESQMFLKQFDLKYNKVASALLTDVDLLTMIAEEKKYTFISTGMSTLEEIKTAVGIFESKRCPFELLHCVSTYPGKNSDQNLAVMESLRAKFNCKTGFSDHTSGRVVSLAAVALGASTIERHITLDKTMYGSDQAASLEMQDFKRLIQDTRSVESAIGSPEKRVMESEIPVRDKLRKK